QSDWARLRQSISARAVSKAAGWIERLAPDAWQGAYEERLREYIEAQIGGRYAPSNARLGQLTGLDLGHYGYALPSPAMPARQGSARPVQ
ncbi:MAG: hypothetical protein WBN70_02605, partial [Polyangiales bacterium]